MSLGKTLGSIQYLFLEELEMYKLRFERTGRGLIPQELHMGITFSWCKELSIRYKCLIEGDYEQ